MILQRPRDRQHGDINPDPPATAQHQHAITRKPYGLVPFFGYNPNTDCNYFTSSFLNSAPMSEGRVSGTEKTEKTHSTRTRAIVAADLLPIESQLLILKRETESNGLLLALHTSICSTTTCTLPSQQPRIETDRKRDGDLQQANSENGATSCGVGTMNST